VAEDLSVVEVRIWGRTVGAVSRPDNPRLLGFYEFQYDKEFALSGLELSPAQMPLRASRVYSFPGLNQETYHGLPGLIADSLPDRFGNALINEYMTRKGVRPQDATTLQRLVYIGRRAMGALEFETAEKNRHTDAAKTSLELATLVEDARRAIRGEASTVTQDILDVGSPAGGARAKAVIGWNRANNEIVAGQFDLPRGFEHWLLKFDVANDGSLSYTQGFGRIEYAHYLMAKEVGIDMSECHLLEEGGRAHFMTKRFDRRGNKKIHVHTLCGMDHLDFNVPRVHSYEQFMRRVLELNLGAPAMEQAWLRCAFNVVAVNCDDHTKNLAFMMDETGKWSLAPAYDMCFSHNPEPGKWTCEHQMRIAGKTWKIEAEDLLQMAEYFGVKHGRNLLNGVIEALAKWPKVGKEVGVSQDQIDHIDSFRPDWARHPLTAPTKAAPPKKRVARKKTALPPVPKTPT
jgi:serine/threonine-protein kinase HipA